MKQTEAEITLTTLRAIEDATRAIIRGAGHPCQSRSDSGSRVARPERFPERPASRERPHGLGRG
jgi:hypothetical protein